jgi:hypothetical protein
LTEITGHRATNAFAWIRWEAMVNDIAAPNEELKPTAAPSSLVEQFTVSAAA